MDDFCCSDWSWWIIRNTEQSENFFNKTFSQNDPDVFFSHLNDINPDLFFSTNNDNSLNVDFIPIDPRIKKPVAEIILDNSNESKKQTWGKIFMDIMTKSTLSKEEHILFLRTLKCCIKRREFPSEKMFSKKRTLEVRRYNEYVKGYEMLYSNRNYEFHNFLKINYLSYLQAGADHILKCPDEIYKIQTAISFKEQPEGTAIYSKVKHIRQEGYVPEFPDAIDYSKLLRTKWTPSLRTQDVVNTNDSLMFYNDIDIISSQKPLLALLCNSDNTETWELPIHVYSSDNDHKKVIIIDDPLPFRFNNSFLLSQTLEYLLYHDIQSRGNISLLSLADGKVNSFESNKSQYEINAVNLNLKYKLMEHDEYSKRFSPKTQHTPHFRNLNNILCKWSLETHADKHIRFNILTKISAPYFSNSTETPAYVNSSFKLEYKSEFGAEVLTKSELIAEWLRQYFMSTGYTKRVRLDADTGNLILIQDFDLVEIEQQLLQRYSIKPSNILMSIYNLFNVIRNFPSGDYLLKRNPKYFDKLIVYAKTTTKTLNGISLHELYKNIQTEVDFMHTRTYIQIDEYVITPIHEFHNLLPSAFPFCTTESKRIGNGLKFRQQKCRTETIHQLHNKKNLKRKCKEKSVDDIKE